MTEPKITILIIKPNKFLFNKQNFNKNDFKQYIESYIEVKEILFSEMMELIVTTVGLTADTMADTNICYETATNIYQLCYLSVNNQSGTDEQINNISGYLTSEAIFGHCILINSKISENQTCVPDNITLDTFYDILYSKIIHVGILVNSSGDVKEIKFFEDPLENCPQESINNFKAVEINFLKFNLIGYIELKPQNNVINKIATRIFGVHRVHGDVLFVHKSSSFEYSDFDQNLFHKIIKLSSSLMEKRDLTDEEKNESEEKINDLPIVINKYFILENRLNQHVEKCDYCHQILNQPFVCTGCYRFKYHNKECQINGWSEHKYSCLLNKKPINLQLLEKIQNT
jgi:hypothetical protein